MSSERRNDLGVLFWIVLATLVNGFTAFTGAVTLWMNEKTFRKAIFFLVAFSAGSLFSGALFHLAAESLETLNEQIVFLLMISGFSLFFIVERFLWWHHCHEGECDVHPVSYLVLIGDSIHNFIDGAVIAASFFVGIHFGILTTVLVLIHELPQELGDFAILIHGGFSKSKALFFNFLSQLTCVLGGILTYYIGAISGHTMFLLPFAAGGFLYISASDLVPELHREPNRARSLGSFVFFLAGVLTMICLKLFSE